jgi:hypothetical protein
VFCIFQPLTSHLCRWTASGLLDLQKQMIDGNHHVFGTGSEGRGKQENFIAMNQQLGYSE